MATPSKTAPKAASQMVEKLKQDVAAEIEAVVGNDPVLIAKLEGALEKIADVAVDDLLAEIHNPIVRKVAQIMLHRALDAGFDSI